MHILKQVILTKDHDAEAECTIFHNDNRAFERLNDFYQRAENFLEFALYGATSIGKKIGNEECDGAVLHPDAGGKKKNLIW